MSTLKRNALSKVKSAIKRGILQRPNVCSVCGKVVDIVKIREELLEKYDGDLAHVSSSINAFMIQAHHDDYSKMLDVRWLCLACHLAWHVLHGTYKNNGKFKHTLRADRSKVRD